MIFYDLLRGAVQISCAAIVAETRPLLEHIVERRGGQQSDRCKSVHKSMEIGNYRRYLGLLQHDLRDPNCVCRSTPPRQVSFVGLKPCEEVRCYFGSLFKRDLDLFERNQRVFVHSDS